MTGSKRIQRELLQCRDLVLSHWHCLPCSKYEKTLYTKTTKDVKLHDSGIVQYDRLFNTGHRGKNCTDLLYSWACRTFRNCIGDLTRIYDAEDVCLDNLVRLGILVRRKAGVGDLNTFSPAYNGWRSLHSLALRWWPSYTKMPDAMYMLPNVAKLSLFYPETLYSRYDDDAECGKSLSANTRSGCLIAPGLVHLVIKTDYTPSISGEWIWNSVIRPNASHLFNLEWHVTKSNCRSRSRRTIFNLRQDCPVLHSLTMSHWTSDKQTTLYLPETLTALSVSDSELPLVCTQHPNLTDLTINCTAVSHDEWTSFIEAFPNVQNLSGDLEDCEIDKTTNRVLLPRLTHVSEAIFWNLDMHKADQMPRLLSSISEDGRLHLATESARYTTPELYELCCRLGHIVTFRLEVYHRTLIKVESSIFSKLMSMPSTKSLYIAQTAWNPAVFANDMMSLDDECIVAENMTAKIHTPSELEQCMALLSTKCAPGALKTLKIGWSAWCPNNMTVWMTSNVSLPESLQYFTCETPVKITSQFLSALPSSLKKLELCTTAQDFEDQLASDQLESVVTCDKIWRIELVKVTGQFQFIVPGRSQGDCRSDEECLPFVSSTAELIRSKRQKLVNVSNLNFEYKRLKFINPRIVPIGWLFGNYGTLST